MKPENHLEISSFYKDKITAFGASAEGVGWNGPAAQQIRFKQLCRLLPKNQKFSLVDLGCGYGELYYYIKEHVTKNCSYIGLDISQAMLDKAKTYLPDHEVNLQLHHSQGELPVCDFLVSSGTFNIKGSSTDDHWRAYVLSYIDNIASKTKFGFAVNFLTSFSELEKKRRDHYYCDPGFIFNYLKTNIAKNVSLLHDYQLYDFTIIVRKDDFFTQKFDQEVF